MAYTLEGYLLEVCTCKVICPCWVGEDPDGGKCDGVVAYHVHQGTVNGVDVAGRSLVLLAHIPGNVLWLQSQAWAISAATLAGAGLYQFPPLKHHCLDKCRSPLSFIMEHWQGERDHVQAFRLGVHHGIFCIGCCWSLMLLMFAVGIGNLGWMLALGAVMAAEKNLPWGRRISAPLGGALVGWGLILAVG